MSHDYDPSAELCRRASLSTSLYGSVTFRYENTSKFFSLTSIVVAVPVSLAKKETQKFLTHRTNDTSLFLRDYKGLVYQSGTAQALDGRPAPL